MTVVSVSPSKASAGALELYDANADGQLDAAELEACPALLKSLRSYDANGDGAVSGEELSTRFGELFQNGTMMTSVVCRVVRGRAPVPQATVRFVPEEFLPEGIQPAEGVTDAQGQTYPAIAGADAEPDMRGIQIGCYRVEVTHGGATTTFGHEVDPTRRDAFNAIFDLSAK